MMAATLSDAIRAGATTVCRACGGPSIKRHSVREMMFGLRDRFDYHECSDCGAIQLDEPTPDLRPYYPDNYYSFTSTGETLYPIPSNPLVRYIYRRRNDAQIFGRSGLWGWLARHRPRTGLSRDWAEFANWPVESLSDPVLDVGCGQGLALRRMAAVGFSSLTGVDPYLPGDIHVGPGFTIYARRLADMPKDRYKLIMFHHSLEHMADHEAELREAAVRLQPEGRCLVRIPVVGEPWRVYGTDWVELDAPRHLFLHTEKSFAIVAARAGLTVERTTYDSDGFAYWGSELYRRDLPLHETPVGGHRDFQSCFTPDEFAAFAQRATRANANRDGGRAEFVLRKS